MKFTLNIKRSEQLVNICGSLDKNLENLATNLDVDISNKGADFNIKGDNADKAVSVLQELLILSEKKTIDFSDIDLSIKSLSSPNGETKSVTIKTSKKHIHIRSDNQQKYVNSIIENDAVFAIGPAGTGTTYLAVARAVEALENSNVKRIVLVRPAVEAGENLGFLPGDLAQKVDPYLRPLYDALYDLAGYDNVTKMFDKGILEVAPLAYMGGRTLNQSFIILDEAQNTTPEQMKMFLTRIGFGTKAVITGDVTQIDLAKSQKSGLIEIQRILKSVKGIEFNFFTSVDVVRHPLVQKIINAYEKFKL